MNYPSAYSAKKTLVKGATPVAVLILVKVIAEIAKANGIAIDDATLLTVAMSGYGAVIAFLNWIKNRKKTK